MSTASSKSVDKPQNAEVSKLGEKGTSLNSPSTSTGQQQSAGDSSVAKEVMSSSPAALIDQKSAGPSTTVEGQLRKQIARLEADIHQLKLDQDPNREALRHTFLRDELAQLREKNLDLRVELQVAQEDVRSLEKKLEKHQVLGSELERCKQLMQKAIDGLSTGFKLSNTKSPNLGLATEAVQSGASLLPQQPVSSGPVETATLVSHAFESNSDTSSSTFPTSSTDTNTFIGFGPFGPPPSHPSQVLFFPPSASQTDQPPTVPPFSGTASASTFSAFHPLATKASSAVTSTAAGFPDSPQGHRPAPRYGDTGKSVQQEHDGSIPHWQNESFEEARLRHYEHSNGRPETELAATPKLQGTLGKSTLGSKRASDFPTLFGGSSTSPGHTTRRVKKESKNGKHSGGRDGQEEQTLGSGNI